eukprot:SAG22_NODE_17905_length_296_cov_1.411168_1_plen_69_part_10
MIELVWLFTQERFWTSVFAEWKNEFIHFIFKPEMVCFGPELVRKFNSIIKFGPFCGFRFMRLQNPGSRS